MEDLIVLLEGILLFEPELYVSLAEKYDFASIYLKEISNKDSKIMQYNTQQLIYFLSMNITPKDLPIEKLPLVQILNHFLNNNVLFSYGSLSHSLYELLPLLIEEYSKLNIKEKLNTSIKFKQIIDYIQAYPSTEVSQSNRIDNFLLGLLKTARKFLTIDSSRKSFDTKESIELIKQVFNSCLFPAETGEYSCRTEATREIAYDIVIALVKDNVECCVQLIRDCIFPMKEKIPSLGLWEKSSNNYERSELGYIGLKNLGCICYINSMLQQFFIILPFRNAIITVRDNIPPQITKEGIDDNLMHQFQRIFIYLLNSNRRDFNPGAFCYSFKELDGRPTNTAIQRDAFEFLNILFERLEKALKDTPYKRLLQSIFGGKSCSQIKCSNCGHIIVTYEDYYTLSLEIKNQRDLNDSLKRYISESTVSDYKCNNCDKKVDVARRTLISTLPNVLIIHLQRFTFNLDTFMNEKIHTRVEFPNVLDMTRYTTEGYEEEKKGKLSYDNEAEIKRKSSDVEGHVKEKADKEPKLNHKEKEKKELKDQGYYNFKLVGVLMHIGNAEGGHYYSYINTNRGKTANETCTTKDKWLEFNDSIISPFVFKDLETECFGGSIDDISTGCVDDNSEVARLIGGCSKSAYMLIYERNKKGVIPLKEEEAEADVTLESLDCDSTAVSRAGYKVYVKDIKETYRLYDYYDLPFKIPNEIAAVNLNVIYRKY